MSHICKRFFRFELQLKQLLTKYQIFTKLPQIPHIHKNRNFSSIIAFFFQTNCFIPINFMAARDMSGVLFFIFASCEPLRQLHFWKLMGLLIGSAMFGATFNLVTWAVSDYRNFWNTERSSLNINSFTWNNCFSYRNFRLPMSALATIYSKCTAKIEFPIGSFYVTILLMLTLEV